VTAWRTHEGFVRGLVFVQHNGRDGVLTCGDDATIKLWQWDPHTQIHPFDVVIEDNSVTPPTPTPVLTFVGQRAFTSLDAQNRLPYHFTTGSGQYVSVWDLQRSNPLHTFEWSSESVLTVKFNPIESHILASSHADRSITLFDLRASTPIRRLMLSVCMLFFSRFYSRVVCFFKNRVMIFFFFFSHPLFSLAQMNSNALSWNPMEVFHFTVANEDHNCYTFDMRKLDIAHNVHTDHVSAVCVFITTTHLFHIVFAACSLFSLVSLSLSL
jgi:WD repeat and SOF domain-containing protein 1